MHWLDRYGYSLNLVAVLLWPISLLFGAAVQFRRWLYQRGLDAPARPFRSRSL
jgi:tetraacyldisaccharide-1-P 4'-kinase